MTLLQILPSDSPLRSSTSRALVSLKPRLEAAQKKETGEMMGKLKELGNSFLGASRVLAVHFLAHGVQATSACRRITSNLNPMVKGGIQLILGSDDVFDVGHAIVEIRFTIIIMQCIAPQASFFRWPNLYYA